MEKSCSRCRCYAAFTALEGLCKAHPPTQVAHIRGDEVIYESNWPIVAGENWCWEFASVVAPYEIKERKPKKE